MIFSDYVFVRILFSTLADLVGYAVVSLSQPGLNLREKIRVFFVGNPVVHFTRGVLGNKMLHLEGKCDPLLQGNLGS